MARQTRSGRRRPSTAGSHPARRAWGRAATRPAASRRPAGTRGGPAERKGGGVGLRSRIPRPGWVLQFRIFLFLTIVIVVVMVLLRAWISQLGAWGYAGAFIISLLSNATIFFPAPGVAVIVMMAQDYNPLLLGLAAGVGGTLGAGTSYYAGVIGGRALAPNGFYRLCARAMGRVGALIIFLFTLLPFLPMDAASIVAGGIRYPFRRYLLWMGIAHVLKMTTITYTAASSTTWLRDWLQPLG